MGAAGAGYRTLVKLIRGAVAVGVAKKVYDVARKPENQARIRSAVSKVRARSGGKGG
jgi:hypothetical protein